MYLQCLMILFQTLGENHPNTNTVKNNFFYFLEQVIKDDRVSELSDHPYTQELLRSLTR